MKESYLEVTFRRGRPLAAYYYLPRNDGDRCARTERAEAGLLIDFSADNRPIGIEITAPATLRLADLNAVLARLGLAPATPTDLSPLLAA